MTSCPMPFSGLDIETNGDVKPCCIFEGTIGNVNDVGFDTIWHGQELADIRADMMSGKMVRGCRQCYLEEETTGTSKRLREMKQYPSTVYTDPAVIKLDIKLGNTCNLKCRICNNQSSSLFNSENQQLNQLGFNENVDVNSKADLPRFKWHKNDDIWDEISQYVDTIEQIDFMGGEPLLDKRHNIILQNLIDAGVSNRIIINYTTNGTIVPNFDLLKQFKQVLFTVSADAAYDRFELCRYPSKWDNFEKNIWEIRKHADSFLISYSVSNYSLFGIPDALDFYTEHGYIVWFNYVHLPQSANCQHLPDELKDEFNHLISTRRSDAWLNTRANIDEVLNFVNGQPYNEKYFRGFIHECKLRDQMRDQNFAKTLPEFANYAHLASLKEPR